MIEVGGEEEGVGEGEEGEGREGELASEKGLS